MAKAYEKETPSKSLINSQHCWPTTGSTALGEAGFPQRFARTGKLSIWCLPRPILYLAHWMPESWCNLLANASWVTMVWVGKIVGQLGMALFFFWRTKMVGRGYNIARKSLLGLHWRFLEQFFVVPRNSFARRKACNTCTCSKSNMDTGYYRIPQIGIQRSYLSNHHLILCQWESIVKHVYTLPKTNVAPWN